MRTFELLIWILSAAWALAAVLRTMRKPVDVAFAVALIAATAVHVAVEGPRFHMTPAYALAAAALLLAAARRRRRDAIVRPPWRRTAGAIVVLAASAISAALPTLFPVFTYATPDGPYGIGTADYELNDTARDRDLVVQAWYPVEPGTRGASAGITSRPDLLAPAYAAVTGLPAALFDNLHLVRTHAIEAAAIVRRGPLPVVLFSHGPGSANRSQSIFQMEALASHGFVVFAIDHTGYASTTIFPDGRTVPLSADFAWPVFVDARSTAMVRTWTDDVRFVLDRVMALNAADPTGRLTGALDLSRVGYVGASFGGSVVVQALLEDARIVAGVAEDGKPYFSDAALTDLRRPLLYMQSAAPYIKSTPAQLAKWGITPTEFRVAEQDHYARQMRLFASAGGPIYNVYIRGTNHVTFSDLGLIIRIPNRDLIDIHRAHRIINDYTIAFFDRYLNGVPATIVDGVSPAPDEEVTVTSRNVPAAAQAYRK